MAELIRTSAYLEMCHVCGKHGHFVLTDGTISKEFCSKEKAREVLAELRQENKVNDFEVKFLESQISESSSLWALDKHASFYTRLTCDIANISPSSCLPSLDGLCTDQVM